jgi:hypothetical protein
MPEQLYYDGRLVGEGSKESIRANELDQDTVKVDTEVTVFQERVNDDQVLYHGYGDDERNQAEAFVGLDLVASGNGAGTAGDPISGDLVLAITDSEGRRVLASRTFEDLDELRDSLTETRSDRVIEPAQAPVATSGRQLELRVEADADSDGFEIDPDASDGKLYFGEIQG